VQKLILKNSQSPGDILMLTAAVRDLHRCHPRQFRTDVRTSCMDLWAHNPHLTRLREDDSKARVLDCHYPLIHQSNSAPMHFLWGFTEHLNQQLGTNVRPTEFRGDIHLSATERAQPSRVAELTGLDLPYWIIVAGGKYDYTIKWWHFRRFQAVVDHFRGRMQFVQVGEEGHYHPPLDGVICLRGRTTLRQLVHLVYHSAGVLCPVTCLMHLAAAVETRADRPNPRPCVVVAGGREPPQWEAYPHHQFIHTVGTLPCCANGGCWRARTVPLGDGDEKDQPEKLCVDVVNGLPRCMDLISSGDVARRIEWFLENGMARCLTRNEARRAALFSRVSHRDLLLNGRATRGGTRP
jgi:ADP-heptose:LPS heptosyltransferase